MNPVLACIRSFFLLFHLKNSGVDRYGMPERMHVRHFLKQIQTFFAQLCIHNVDNLVEQV